MQNSSSIYSPSPWPNESLIHVYIGLGIFGVLLLIRVWLSKADGTAAFVRQHPIVLLPTMFMNNLIWLLGHVPLVTAATPTSHFLNLSISLSLLFVITLVGNPLAVWATVQLTHEFADAYAPPPSLKLVWRFVAASLLSTAGMFALLLVVGPMLPAIGAAALVLMGAAWLVFNLLSCTWYAAMMTDDAKLWASLRDAAVFGLRRWWPLSIRVLGSLLFSGFLVFYSIRTEHYAPPPLPSPPVLPTGSRSSFSSSSISGGSFGSSISDGWAIQLHWVLSADRGNAWLNKTAAEAKETPWSISRYLVDNLTVLVATYFIVGISLIYLRRPISARVDRRKRFEVLPLPIESDAKPLPVFEAAKKPAVPKEFTFQFRII